MVVTDPIADMLTRIRNAQVARHETVDVPASNMKKSIAQILLSEGYIKGYTVIDDGVQGVIRITLKYGPNKTKVITGLKAHLPPRPAACTPAKDQIPRVLGGLGIAILSTSKGVVTSREARELGVGGEVLAYVW